MKHFVYIFLPILPLFLSGCQRAEEPGRPNIIIIMADDMGYSDIGFFGSEIATPNIDQLAREGLVMTDFYNSSRCCPSRASLLTGLYQHRAGIGFMTGDMGYPAYQGYLNDSCVTIAEVLGREGYHTFFSGKWHVGSRKGHWPLDRGFQRSYGFPRGGGIYFWPWHHSRRNAVLVHNDQPVEADSSFYSTDAFTRHALGFIEEFKDSANPFFLYLAYIAPHFPVQAHPDDIKKYQGSYMAGFRKTRENRFRDLQENNLLPEQLRLSPPDTRVLEWDKLTPAEKEEYDLRMAAYAAQVDCMDRNVGQLIDKLKEWDEFDNTVIFFLSDNGASNEGPLNEDTFMEEPPGSRSSWTSYRASWANVSNTPFRLYKHWVHEGGISTPLIISWPAVIKKQRIDAQTGHIIDLMPTCCDLAAADYPVIFDHDSIIPYQGISLLPVIRGDMRRGHNYLFWEHMGNKAVRMNKWKLVMDSEKRTWELYDLERDRMEMTDLSGEHPDLVDHLITQYQGWAQENGVMPWDSIAN